MTHQQSQSQQPLVSQEIQALEEEHLEEVAGGGGISLRSCFGCFPRKSSTTQTTSTTNPQPTTDHPQSFVLRSESTRDMYTLIAGGASINRNDYERYKQQQQQQQETVAGFKELPFHPH